MIKNLLYFSILTSIFVLSWVGFGIYHNHITSTISTDTGILITPIPGSFDTKTIEQLKQRNTVPADLGAKRVGISPTPTPSIQILPSGTPTVSSGSAEL